MRDDDDDDYYYYYYYYDYDDNAVLSWCTGMNTTALSHRVYRYTSCDW